MALTIENLVVDCSEPYALAEFWSEVTGRPLGDEDEPGDEEVGVELGHQTLLFVRVPEPKTVKNRLHLCLRPDGRRDDEVARLLGIGARIVDDRRDREGWAVLGDPEGNEFCVLRGAADPAATSQG